MELNEAKEIIKRQRKYDIRLRLSRNKPNPLSHPSLVPRWDHPGKPPYDYSTLVSATMIVYFFPKVRKLFNCDSAFYRRFMR